MLNLDTRQIFVSKDIVFDEEIFPFLTLPLEDVQVKSTSYDAMSYTVSPIQVLLVITAHKCILPHLTLSLLLIMMFIILISQLVLIILWIVLLIFPLAPRVSNKPR